MGKSKQGFYAVARGRTVGIFPTWEECKTQVDGFKNSRYKKFTTTEEAEAFIKEHRDPVAPGPAVNVSFASAAPENQPTSTANSFSPASPNQVVRPSTLASKPRGGKKRAWKPWKVTKERVTKRGKFQSANSEADLRNFTVDNDGYVVVFTDGVCAQNGKWGAKAGIDVYFGSENSLNIREPVQGRQTQHTAGIQAAERAIIAAKLNGIKKLNIRTDSPFTINCVTKWIHHWKENNWILKNGEVVKNKTDLIKLDAAMEDTEIKWSYVRGHEGIRVLGNKAADRLARSVVNLVKKARRQRQGFQHEG